MPIIKSAIKRDRQNEVRRARNYNVRTALKKSLRQVDDLMKEDKKEDLTKAVSKAFKIIDTAAKKKILSKNTAGRRKARLAKMTSSKE